jgi:hypothetical protein
MTPDTEIHLVVSDHPPKEQIQPLAPAAGRRSWKKVLNPWPAGNTPVDGTQIDTHRACRKRIQRPADIGRASVRTFEKKSLDRPVLEHRACNPKQRGQIDAARPTMDDTVQLASVTGRFESADEFCRRRPKHLQDPLD